jgi:multiple sugar transport system permease protein
LIFSQGTALWPEHATMANYSNLFQQFPFLSWYRNSIIVAILFTAGQLFSCSLTAFALVYFKLRGRNLILLFALGTMMLPFQVLMVPLFLIMKTLGWLNTLYPLFVPAFFGDVTGAVEIFLLRQAFMQIPKDFAEAAYMDGANPIQIFYQIYIPLTKPFFTVLSLLSFMTSWNDLTRPLVFINERSLMTVTGGLSFFQTEFHIQWGAVMAGTCWRSCLQFDLFRLTKVFCRDGSIQRSQRLASINNEPN